MTFFFKQCYNTDLKIFVPYFIDRFFLKRERELLPENTLRWWVVKNKQKYTLEVYQGCRNYWMVYKFEYFMKLNRKQLLWIFYVPLICLSRVECSKWLQIHQTFNKFLKNALWRSSTVLRIEKIMTFILSNALKFYIWWNFDENLGSKAPYLPIVKSNMWG